MSKSCQNVRMERDCTPACRSKMHASECVSAATKRGVSDKQLASYLYHLCANFAKKQDEVGRSVLHIAASCGKVELCQWLVTCAGANPNARDFESGYTPLHRAIYYGHIDVAVRLLQFGANLDVFDNEDMTALDMLCRERSSTEELGLTAQCQPYVWGVNKNYSLGTGSDDTRKTPDLLEFAKHSVSVKQIALEELHSVFVSSCGKAWSCGMGQGGRLGCGSNNSLLTPQPIKTHDRTVKEAAVAINHTLILLDNHTVLSFGSNHEHQLGLYPYVESCLSPRQVYHSNFSSSSPITGVLAAKYHSVFYSESAVYTCGLNGGQLGRSSPATTTSCFITQPFKVPLSLNGRKVTNVATSTGAIVVAVSKGDVYVIHRFQCKKMTSKLLDVVKIGCFGGSLECEGVTEPGSELRIVILTSRGSLLLWKENVQQPTRCVFSTKQCINVNDFCLTQQHILLVTKDGTAFQGSFTSTPQSNVLSGGERAGPSRGNQFHKFVERSECYSIKLKRLPNIFRGVAISSDPRGNNFAVIQTHPKSALTDIPVISDSEMPQQMAALFQEASEDDAVHDAVIKTSGREFAVHCFVLSDAAALLAEEAHSKGTLDLRDTNPYILEQVLLFLYTGSCLLTQPGPFDSRKIGKREDPVKIAIELCNRYRIQTLSRRLQKLRYEGGMILMKDGCDVIATPRLRFDRKAGSDMYDVTVKSEDGSTIKAHKCILAARLDYFHSMFLGGWSETSKNCVLPLPFPFRIMKDLIDFIYTDDVPDHLSADEDLDHIIRLLIAGDQLLVTRLKECCELVLIDALTLRNAPTVLHLSSVYNCPQLKASTVQFISLNLASFLQSRLLEVLEDSVLKELSDYYREFSTKNYRMLTPFCGAPLDEIIESTPPIPWPDEFSFNQKSNILVEMKSPPSSGKKKKSGGKKTLASALECLELSEHGTLSPLLPRQPLAACDDDNLKEGRDEAIVDLAGTSVDTIHSSPVHHSPDTAQVWHMSHFPLLDSPTVNSKPKTKILHPPHAKSESSRKLFAAPTKLSQKERKRLSSESEKQTDNVVAPLLPAKPVKTWAVLPPLPSNLPSTERNVNRESFSEEFVDIIAHDKEKKANLAKMKSKPFHLTQLEERAMDELMVFYNASNECDERITVDRVVSQNIDKPQWITTSKQL